LSVGALNAAGTARADYSNYGSWVDVYARGSDMVNAFPDGRYVYDEPPHKGEVYQFVEGLAKWSGTSFATPLVAGLIAGRMSRTGESARDAADALKKLAVANAKPGVGPILRPGMASLD
jgi:subtilisin family serine protease